MTKTPASHETLFSGLLPAADPFSVVHPLRYFAEALLASSISIYVTFRLVEPKHAGILSIFFTAAGLAERFSAILRDHHRQTFELQFGGGFTSGYTARCILCLFCGIAVAYGGCAWLLDERAMARGFAFVWAAAGVGQDTIMTRQFGEVLGLLQHNGIVLLTFASLAFLYWSYGALLALGWNACIWAMVLAVLTRRGMEAGGGASPLWTVAVGYGAVLPHLLLEAAAYVLATMAAIFLAQALKGPPAPDDRPTRGPLLRASARNALWAALAVVLGALCEGLYAPRVLALLGR